jgi:hypothetical protein
VTFQLQIDKNSFQFHILYIGMNPLEKDASTRTKEDIQSIKRVYRLGSRRRGNPQS